MRLIDLSLLVLQKTRTMTTMMMEFPNSTPKFEVIRMYLRISDLAGSSGCVPYLSSKFRTRGGTWRGGSKSFFPPTFSQELGTAVHELIQYVLAKPPEERRQIAEEMERDLGVLRTTLQPSEVQCPGRQCTVMRGEHVGIQAGCFHEDSPRHQLSIYSLNLRNPFLVSQENECTNPGASLRVATFP